MARRLEFSLAHGTPRVEPRRAKTSDSAEAGHAFERRPSLDHAVEGASGERVHAVLAASGLAE